MEENKFDEEKDNEEQIYAEKLENNVYNPYDKEQSKKLYEIQLKMNPKKAKASLIFAIVYMVILFFMAIFNVVIFLILFFGGIFIFIPASFISAGVKNEKQNKYKKFMLENIEQLKEYNAKIVLITAIATVKNKKKTKSVGFKIYCEVDGKYYERLIEGNYNYSVGMEIKIYMHDKVPNFFLTEEEYLHSKM